MARAARLELPWLRADGVVDSASRNRTSFRKRAEVCWPALRAHLPTYAKGQNPYASTRVHHPQDLNVPIGCGGVAVIPGDVIVGDGEGVVVIPRAVAEEVIQGAYEQDQREAFLMQKILRGDSILGVYPPDSRTLEDYERWKRASSG